MGRQASDRHNGSIFQVLEDADLIWMSGGSQVRLMRALDDAGLTQALQKLHAEGKLFGGSSAGAAVMSKLMITGEEQDLKDIRSGTTSLGSGLGLLTGAIIDQHFSERRRSNRLLAALLEHPTKIGIGIDERTAVLVEGSSLTVLGEGNVVILDPRSAVFEGKHNDSTYGIRMHILTNGSAYSLQEVENQAVPVP